MDSPVTLNITIQGFDPQLPVQCRGIGQMGPNHIVYIVAGPWLTILGAPVEDLIRRAFNIANDANIPVINQEITCNITVPFYRAEIYYSDLVRLMRLLVQDELPPHPDGNGEIMLAPLSIAQQEVQEIPHADSNSDDENSTGSATSSTEIQNENETSDSEFENQGQAQV